jgi:hypothetical protein
LRRRSSAKGRQACEWGRQEIKGERSFEAQIINERQAGVSGGGRRSREREASVYIAAIGRRARARHDVVVAAG